jgi:hypothetical protein
MNWNISQPGQHSYNLKPLNSAPSSHWNVQDLGTQNPFFSSPVTKQDREWPFSGIAVDSSVSSPVEKPDRGSTIQSSLFPDQQITLDDLFNFSDCPNDTGVDTIQSDVPNDTSEFDSFFQMNQTESTVEPLFPAHHTPLLNDLNDSSMLSSFTDSMDPLASSFAFPPSTVDPNAPSSTNDMFWNDFFHQASDTTPFVNPSSLFLNSNLGDLTLGGIFDAVEPSQEVETVDTPPPMTISKDEVDDLFKEAIQQSEDFDSLAKQEKQVEWVTNNT